MLLKLLFNVLRLLLLEEDEEWTIGISNDGMSLPWEGFVFPFLLLSCFGTGSFSLYTKCPAYGPESSWERGSSDAGCEHSDRDSDETGK